MLPVDGTVDLVKSIKGEQEAIWQPGHEQPPRFFSEEYASTVRSVTMIAIVAVVVAIILGTVSLCLYVHHLLSPLSFQSHVSTKYLVECSPPRRKEMLIVR